MAWDEGKPADADNAATMMNGVIANWAAIETVCTSDRLDNLNPIPDFFPTGTICYFYVDAAPTGWTIYADAGDELLAIKGGSSTYENGGVQAGTWTQPAHILTEAELPSHSHTYTQPNAPENKRSTGGSAILEGLSSAQPTGSTGGGEAHHHGEAWRPAGRVGILCSKDVPS